MPQSAPRSSPRNLILLEVEAPRRGRRILPRSQRIAWAAAPGYLAARGIPQHPHRRRGWRGGGDWIRLRRARRYRHVRELARALPRKRPAPTGAARMVACVRRASVVLFEPIHVRAVESVRRYGEARTDLCRSADLARAAVIDTAGCGGLRPGVGYFAMCRERRNTESARWRRCIDSWSQAAANQADYFAEPPAGIPSAFALASCSASFTAASWLPSR